MSGLRFAVAVLAKAPVAGYAKTRLTPLLGAAGAARAQRGFVLRTLRTAAAADAESITLWCAPDSGQRFFRAMRRCEASLPQLRFAHQGEGDIGRRMAQAFSAHARRHGPIGTPARVAPLLLVGTDCPALSATHLRDAAAALIAGDDAVFVPVEDGGYVLVGLRDAAATFSIFDGIDWSTSRVMTQTRNRLRAAGARWHELAPLWDVDEPADWLRWQAHQVSARSSPHATAGDGAFEIRPPVTPASADRPPPVRRRPP